MKIKSAQVADNDKLNPFRAVMARSAGVTTTCRSARIPRRLLASPFFARGHNRITKRFIFPRTILPHHRLLSLPLCERSATTYSAKLFMNSAKMHHTASPARRRILTVRRVDIYFQTRSAFNRDAAAPGYRTGISSARSPDIRHNDSISSMRKHRVGGDIAYRSTLQPARRWSAQNFDGEMSIFISKPHSVSNHDAAASG